MWVVEISFLVQLKSALLRLSVGKWLLHNNNLFHGSVKQWSYAYGIAAKSFFVLVQNRLRQMLRPYYLGLLCIEMISYVECHWLPV